ncbi:MAG: O-acetyl-ADP-ribose deacetylase [Pyrinomonadaceae bacterium]
MEKCYLDGRVRVFVGEITSEKVDAIVNAGNSTLLGGGGVDGAIHGKGGPTILAECVRIRISRYPDGLPTGQAVITTAGDLPARYVIHTVGPIFGAHRGAEGELLSSCYERSLSLASDNSLTSIAFPTMSTGIYRYPKDMAAKISSTAVSKLLSENHYINDVRFVFLSDSDFEIFVENQSF